MRKILILAAAAIGMSGVAQAADITGAGATFPFPIYAKWAEASSGEVAASCSTIRPAATASVSCA